LLLLPLLYQLIWLLGVGLPLWQQGLLDVSGRELRSADGSGVVLHALVIPRAYAQRRYRAPANQSPGVSGVYSTLALGVACPS
jgi:hypothetical protein